MSVYAYTVRSALQSANTAQYNMLMIQFSPEKTEKKLLWTVWEWNGVAEIIQTTKNVKNRPLNGKQHGTRNGTKQIISDNWNKHSVMESKQHLSISRATCNEIIKIQFRNTFPICIIFRFCQLIYSLTEKIKFRKFSQFNYWLSWTVENSRENSITLQMTINCFFNWRMKAVRRSD